MRPKTNKGLLAFELLILAVAVYFVVVAFGYNARARLVPILIGVPTILLIAFQIALDHVPAFKNLGPSKVKLINRDIVAKKEKPKVDSGDLVQRELAALAWVIGLGVALSVFGYYIVLPVFLACFLRFAADLDWARALVSTVLATGILYAAFVWFLRVDLYPGLVPLIG